MNGAQALMDQMLLPAAVMSGIVLVVGIGLLLHELYLEFKRRAASRTWKEEL
jgi:hypothetical protein